jgi:glycosyltransferase involved in cell wall biosynthesis
VQVPYQDHRVYPWLMARCRAVLAPIEEVNEFTNAKSALKVFEAGAFSVPAIASPTVEYREAIEDGLSGLIADRPEDWERALLTLCERGHALALGAAARKVASIRRGGFRMLPLSCGMPRVQPITPRSGSPWRAVTARPW